MSSQTHHLLSQRTSHRSSLPSLGPIQPVGGTPKRVPPTPTAIEQLDWAIRLFLDHKAYIPAITLAAAAEEIFGKLVGEKAAFLDLKKHFSNGFGISEKIVSQEHLNYARNLLKQGPIVDQDEVVL